MRSEKENIESVLSACADEHHVLVISRLSDESKSRQWFMSIFDLSDRHDSCGGSSVLSLSKCDVSLDQSWQSNESLRRLKIDNRLIVDLKYKSTKKSSWNLS